MKGKVEILRGFEEEGAIHRYPYSSMPPLESHVHPKFAIFDAGRKLKMLFEESESNQILNKVVEDYPSLSKIQRLYRVWIQPPPNASRNDTSYIDPNFELVSDPPEDISSDGSEYDAPKRARTLLGRGDGFYLRQKTRSMAAGEQAGNGDGTQAGNAQAGKGDRAQVGNVDDNGARGGKRGCGGKRGRKAPKKRKVLSESFTHNQHRLSEVTLSRINQQFEEAAWTADRIREWSSLSKRMRHRFH